MIANGDIKKINHPFACARTISTKFKELLKKKIGINVKEIMISYEII